MSETEKKNADEILEIIKKILDYNKNAQKSFQSASKVNNGKSEPKPEESISEKSEPKSDRSIPKWVQVSEDKFNFLKLKINKNKDLSTTIDKRYILNDTNELVNKIAKQKINKNNTVKACHNLVNNKDKKFKIYYT